jgi:glucose/arabinose dehydrogenase/PKD repeat protein
MGHGRAPAWMVAVVVLVLLVMSEAAGAQTFTDPGFTVETVAVLDMFTPVGLAFAPAPDNRIFIWQKPGVVRIVRDGVLLSTPFLDIQARVNQFTDRGLLGLALDPQFASNGHVYLAYTIVAEPGGDVNDPGPTTAQLTRVTADPNNPDVALPDSEVVLLAGIPSTSCCHSIGTLRFAPDGTLFMGSGDGAEFAFADTDALRSQDLDSLNGKILRLNPDGSAAQDNPFSDGTNSNRSKVWSYGLRNPFRFSLHPDTGEPVIGDVGWNDWEEINIGRGANFGWPCFEGAPLQPEYHCTADAVTPPLYAYHHTDPDHFGVTGRTIVAGPIYTGTEYPPEYQGSLFIADYTENWIQRLIFDDHGIFVGVAPFANGADGPVALEQGPEGALYYVALNSGEVRRIRFNGPQAKITATPTSGLSPLTVNFKSTGSTTGPGVTYRWSFGDNSPISSALNPTKTYTASGVQTFTATLTVTDGGGRSSSDAVVITVGSRPPVPTISSPANGLKVFPGQTITYQVSATDPDEGPLGDNALSVVVLLHHDTHVHVLQTTTGREGSFQVTNHGAGSFGYEIVLTARDASGLTATTSVLLPANPDHLPFPTAVTFSPATVVGGVSASGLVKISSAAPAGGLRVALSSADPAVAVPAFVTVPAGATQVGFTALTAKTVTQRTEVRVTAALNGSTFGTLAVDAPAETTRTDLVYTSRASLLAAGWNFLAKRRTELGGSIRDTEQTTGLVVSYDQDLHPGRLRIPVDAGDIFGDANDNTRNTLFRDLPSRWSSIRMKIAAFAPFNNFQSACLGAYQDDGNYYVVCRDFATEQLFETWHESNSQATVHGQVPTQATSNILLRIDRDLATETLASFVSLDEGVTWVAVGGGIPQMLMNPKLMIFVGGNQDLSIPRAADIAWVEVLTLPQVTPSMLGVAPAAVVLKALQGGPSSTTTLSITDASNGSLSWLASASESWVSLSRTAGEAPGALAITANSASLPPGTYAATVTVTSPGATGSPRSLNVSLTVSPRGQHPLVYGPCRVGAGGPCGGRR